MDDAPLRDPSTTLRGGRVPRIGGPLGTILPGSGPLARRLGRARGIPVLADLAAGGASGLAATIPMTLAMAAAQRAGLLGRLPPDTVTRHAVRRAGAPRQAQRPETTTLSTAAHLGFGVAAGAVFVAADDALRPPGPVLLHAVAYASLVWAASYAGWIPALGLMPPPHETHPSRPLTMIGAHWVYGLALGGGVLATRRLLAR